MKKTYLDRIGVGLEDARLLLGTGLTELFYSKISQSTDTGDEKSGHVSQTAGEKGETIDPGTNQTDTPEGNGRPDPEKKEYTRVEMGFFETPRKDVQYGLDTFRGIYTEMRNLAGHHPKSDDFSISADGHRFRPFLQMTKDIVRYGESFLTLADSMKPDNKQQRRELRIYYDQVTDSLGKLQDYLFEADKFKV
jgi:hypothetical protein